MSAGGGDRAWMLRADLSAEWRYVSCLVHVEMQMDPHRARLQRR